MIPLRDTIPVRRFPVVNTALIALNVLVFLFESILSTDQLDRFIWQWGLVPARLWTGGGVVAWLALFTSMFMHGGWMHLISNMFALYIFGDNVEDRLGPARYILFYLCSGLAASAVHLVAYSGSSLPTVGASGAIAGVLGAYLVLYPRARVVTLVPIFYFIRIIEIPALIYLGFWFISQLFNGFFALATTDVLTSGGVAWWAHIGGFVFGVVVIRMIAPRISYTFYYDDDYDNRYPPLRDERQRWW